MKAFSPKSKPETQQANQERKRATSRDGLSVEAAASRASGFVDNRPEAIAQRKLQALVDQSPQLQRQAQLQAMIDNSPRQVAQLKQLEQSFGEPVQRQEGLDEEELQMQAAPGTAQRQSLEDEELLQGKMEPVQRQDELEEELLQGKFDPVQRQGLQEEDLLQGRFAGSEPPTQRQGVEDAEDNRTGMPAPLKAGLEQLSGFDLSDVRVHYNSTKPAQLNALAYAQGRDIEVGQGQEQHLAHEGWHAVQQMQGRVKPTMQAKGVSINDDEALEHEANVMGAQAAVHQASKSVESDPIDSPPPPHPRASHFQYAIPLTQFIVVPSALRPATGHLSYSGRPEAAVQRFGPDDESDDDSFEAFLASRGQKERNEGDNYFAREEQQVDETRDNESDDDSYEYEDFLAWRAREKGDTAALNELRSLQQWANLKSNPGVIYAEPPLTRDQAFATLNKVERGVDANAVTNFKSAGKDFQFQNQSREQEWGLLQSRTDENEFVIIGGQRTGVIWGSYTVPGIPIAHSHPYFEAGAARSRTRRDIVKNKEVPGSINLETKEIADHAIPGKKNKIQGAISWESLVGRSDSDATREISKIFPSASDIKFSADNGLREHTVLTPYVVVKLKDKLVVVNPNFKLPDIKTGPRLGFKIFDAKPIAENSDGDVYCTMEAYSGGTRIWSSRVDTKGTGALGLLIW